jgi:hypothetical protein
MLNAPGADYLAWAALLHARQSLRGWNASALRVRQTALGRWLGTRAGGFLRDARHVVQQGSLSPHTCTLGRLPIHGQVCHFQGDWRLTLAVDGEAERSRNR